MIADSERQNLGSPCDRVYGRDRKTSLSNLIADGVIALFAVACGFICVAAQEAQKVKDLERKQMISAAEAGAPISCVVNGVEIKLPAGTFPPTSDVRPLAQYIRANAREQCKI